MTLSFHGLLARVVGRTRERAGFHVMKSERHSNLTPFRKFFRSYVSLDRQTARVWLEILANGHDVAGDGAQVMHEVHDFIECFPKTHHDAALGKHAPVFAIAPGRGALQKG